jgi:hypothetical protein
MSRKEEIQTSVGIPSMPARRTDAAGKAEELLGQGRKADGQDESIGKKARTGKTTGRKTGTADIDKITARVLPEQGQWVRDEVKRYAARHPRRPRLTIDLLMRVAIDHLREAEDFDAVVTRHLS